ncbi:Hypothetical predicted protein [Lecanosticta acicola]|uniref:Uncharacterized protein n=1 Tax=Lecanosticta acicola TaxID=111012 RepID=A0AAI8YVL8_9PEZI|nr:Hypothetical predicted protein [Lecanosticta acicola]
MGTASGHGESRETGQTRFAAANRPDDLFRIVNILQEESKKPCPSLLRTISKLPCKCCIQATRYIVTRGEGDNLNTRWREIVDLYNLTHYLQDNKSANLVIHEVVKMVQEASLDCAVGVVFDGDYRSSSNIEVLQHMLVDYAVDDLPAERLADQKQEENEA